MFLDYSGDLCCSVFVENRFTLGLLSGANGLFVANKLDALECTTEQFNSISTLLTCLYLCASTTDAKSMFKNTCKTKEKLEVRTVSILFH